MFACAEQEVRMQRLCTDAQNGAAEHKPGWLINARHSAILASAIFLIIKKDC
jgi:hypothetical protein